MVGLWSESKGEPDASMSSCTKSLVEHQGFGRARLEWWGWIATKVCPNGVTTRYEPTEGLDRPAHRPLRFIARVR